MQPLASTACTDSLLRVACQTLSLSAILRLATDGEEAAGVGTAHNGLQGAASEVKTTNSRTELMAIIEGLKSIPYGNEVKIVTTSTDVITVAARGNPKLKNRHLALALGAELAKVHASFPHVYSHSGDLEHDLVDRITSAAVRGRMGCRRVKPCTGRQPRLAATEVNRSQAGDRPLWSNPRHVIAFTASCLLIALLLIASAEERSNKMTLQLSQEQMEVLSSASNTRAGIYKDLDASGVAQGMLDDCLSRDKAFRSRGQTKSSDQ